LLQAMASAGILAIGGWLVISRQLTLGQLVAAELIVVSILSAIDKLVDLLETGYDLLTGLDKVGHITDLPLERRGGTPLILNATGGISVAFHNVHFAYENNRKILNNVSLALPAGQRLTLVGASGAGKSTMASLMCGLIEPDQGFVEVNGVDTRDIDLQELHKHVVMVQGSGELFHGSVEENILVGREHVSSQDLRWALDMTELTEDMALRAEGLQSQVISEGRNLSKGERQRVLIARAIVGRPAVLILDDAFIGIDERTKLKLFTRLSAAENPWTLLTISQDAEIVARSSSILLLQNGRIQETGTLETLLNTANSALSTLFPDLYQQFRTVNALHEKQGGNGSQ
jgi:ABC-type bacteriocin/lantibiotic exporter with double-glycine peptidase domain